MLGPTCTLRSWCWARTSLRKPFLSEAYCSKGMRSWRVSFFTSGARQSVGHSEQSERMRRRGRGVQAAFDLMSRQGASAGLKVRAARLHTLYDRPADLHGFVPEFPLDPVGPVVTRTAFDGFHGGSRNQLQYVASLESNILDSQMAGHMVRDLAERACEIRAHLSGLVPQRQVLERI